MKLEEKEKKTLYVLPSISQIGNETIFEGQTHDYLRQYTTTKKPRNCKVKKDFYNKNHQKLSYVQTRDLALACTIIVFNKRYCLITIDASN